MKIDYFDCEDALLDGAPVHLLNTDPPYNVKVEPRSNNAIAAGLSSFAGFGNNEHAPGAGKGLTHHQSFDVHRGATHAHGTTKKMRAKDRPLENDFVSDDAFEKMLHAWFGNIARVLLPGRCFYIWGGYANCGNYPPVLKVCELYFSQAIIWVKEHPVLTRKDFMGNHEWCFYGWRMGAGHKFYGPNITGVTGHVKELAAKRGVDRTLHITTNATLLDDERIRFLDENGFSLIVSLDGPQEIHNRMRPAKSGALNSQQATVANLRKFKGRGLARRTTLRSTFTGAGIDMLPRIEYLNALIEDGCASHMSVEACSLNETACLRLPDGHPLAITPAHYDALAQEYHVAANWYVAQVRAGKRPSLQQFAWALRRLLYTQHSCTECGAGCGYLSVDPGGHLFACHREGKSVIGHLDTGVDEELRAKWKDNRFYTRPDCIACPMKYLCGGGCRMNSLDRHDDIRKPDEVDCFLKRRMFEEALWIMCELGPEKLQEIFPK